MYDNHQTVESRFWQDELSGNPARDLVRSPNLRAILFLALHVGLAFVLDLSSWIGTVHGLAVLVFGCLAAFRRNDAAVLGVLGYIAGSEILWRMTRTNLLWEYGKYASILIVAVALLSRWYQPADDRPDHAAWPYFYLALFVPAILLTFSSKPFGEAIDQISFNASGHFAFIAIGLWLYQSPLQRDALLKLCWFTIAPILAIATRAIYSTVTSEFNFTLDSSLETSAGYGPNQVSNILGLGALLAFVFIFMRARKSGVSLLIGAVSLVLISQSLLTFSRGGVFSLALAFSALTFNLTLSSTARWRVILTLLAAVLAGYFLIFPALDSYADNLLGERLTSADATGRFEVIAGDWAAFQENPIFGVGIGEALRYRRITFGSGVASHTEPTRLLAEHGLFGLIVLGMMIVLPIRSFVQADSAESRAIIAAFTVWSFAVIVQNGTRFVAISLILALSLAAWQLGANKDDSTPTTIAQ